TQAQGYFHTPDASRLSSGCAHTYARHKYGRSQRFHFKVSADLVRHDRHVHRRRNGEFLYLFPWNHALHQRFHYPPTPHGGNSSPGTTLQGRGSRSQEDYPVYSVWDGGPFTHSGYGD